MFAPHVVLSLVLSGCSGGGGDGGKDEADDTGAGGDSDSGTDSGTEPPPCEGVAFGPAETWSLPGDLPNNLGTYSTSGIIDCRDADFEWYYESFDLTGDGRLDLVVTRDECDDDRTGLDYWAVWPGTDSGFGARTTWSLPADLPNNSGTFSSSGVIDCRDTNFEWYSATFDLTGDGRLDLVVTRDECDDDRVGVDYWLVWPGEDGGFGARTTWNLPSDLPNNIGTYSPSGIIDCRDANFEWYYETFDVTGDGALDLVVTRDECDDDRVGVDYWAVWPGEADGFGARTSWTLPSDLPNNSGTFSSSGIIDCRDAKYEWYYATFDLTGDGQLDLVVTRDECDDDRTGLDYWVVWPGGDSGFGARATWSLPSDLPNNIGTFSTSGIIDCRDTKHEWYYETFDLTGDGGLDLVVTRDECDDDRVGVDYWVLWPGEADGFGARATWGLPSDLPENTGTFSSSGILDCRDTDLEWYYATFDLTGDGLQDLVVSRDECGDSEVGTSYWRVWPGVCE